MVQTRRRQKASEAERPRNSDNYNLGEDTESDAPDIRAKKEKRGKAARQLAESGRSKRSAIPSSTIESPAIEPLAQKRQKKTVDDSIPNRRPVTSLPKKVNHSPSIDLVSFGFGNRPLNTLEPSQLTYCLSIAAAELKAAYSTYNILRNAQAFLTQLHRNLIAAATDLETAKTHFTELNEQFNHPISPNLSLPFYHERLEAWHAVFVAEEVLKSLKLQQVQAERELEDAESKAEERKSDFEKKRAHWDVLEAYVSRYGEGKGRKKEKGKIPKVQKRILDAVREVLKGGN